MRNKSYYKVIGLVATIVTSIVLNLISTSIQQITFKEQFTRDNIIWLILILIVSIIVGYITSSKLEEKASSGRNDRAISIKDIESRRGSLRVRDETGKGAEITSASIHGDIDIVAAPRGDEHPKS